VTSFPTLLLAVKEITAVGTIRYTAGCFEAAIDLLAQGKIDIKPLITKSFPLEQIEDALNAVIEGKEMKVVVTNY
jgi:D-xylulose reductase